MTRALACVLACALAACDTTPPDPTEEPPADVPVVVEVFPESGATEVFTGTHIEVWFDRRVDDPGLTLAASGGGPAPGLLEVAEDGRSLRFDPTDLLAPSTEHTMTIAMAPADPVQVSFTTSRHGDPLDDPGDLRGAVFLLDTSQAEFVAPEIGGGVLLTQLSDAALLVGYAPESTLALEDQPGLHFRVSASRGEGDELEQDPCGRTASPTFGLDGEIGTDDDAPASWEDPDILMGPRDIAFAVGLLQVQIHEFVFTGLVHPDGGDWMGGVIGGTIDTRGVDPLLDSSGEVGLICDLLAAGDVECIECGGDNPGLYCIEGRVEGVIGQRVDVPPLVTRTCVQIVAHFAATGECAEEVALWDADEDGLYEGCPGAI